MQTMHGVLPHIMVIGIPQDIMRFMVSQHIFSMSMLIMPVGIIMQVMPVAVISQVIFGIIGMPQQLIMGMPAHIIPTGQPQAIISVSMVHMLFIISMLVPSAGIIMHFMPLSVMEQDIWHAIGIIDATGMLAGSIVDDMFIGICMAGFMVTSWLDNDPCWEYSRAV